MDIETIQLLNLSPIPELSEIELSTMMDQLSGLSDINGDFSDQTVEDILKKAEDLIDKSSSNNTIELNVKEIFDAEELKLLTGNQEFKDDAESDIQDLNVNDCKHYNTPVHSDHTINHLSNDVQKQNNSPAEQTPTKILSPEGSCNHIKSTIDSLKEFSTLIEKQLSNRTPELSPNEKKILRGNEKLSVNKVADDHLTEKYNSPRVIKSQDSASKKNLLEPLNKSVKFLNCFERLYQNKPLRFCTNKKQKIGDKIPKTLSKKKMTNDVNGTLKNNKSAKNLKINTSHGVVKSASENMHQNGKHSSPQTSINLINYNKTTDDSSPNSQTSSNSKSLDDKMGSEPFLENTKSDSPRKENENNDSQLILSKIDQKLILKVLEEVEQIKHQVKKAGVLDDSSSPEKAAAAAAEDQVAVDTLKSEVETVREKVTTVSNAGIKRLQEQFSILKLKYYQQMDKLESENSKLREALHSQQKFFASKRNSINLSPSSENCLSTETRNYKISITSSPSSCETEKKTMQNVSTSSIAPSSENISDACLQKKTSKEAFCQTEKETSHMSTQCTPEVAEEEKRETIIETKKTDNKENLTLKNKFIRSKPFTDVGLQQLSRQKKLLDHESQLLATLRGLQTELTLKEKENKRMRTEMESLKKQIKKLVSCRMENVRRSHVGTQTIGLGPSVQKPYVPDIYEVPKEFEKENENLKSRIKALEVDFELLKEKRVNDLQSLHQVHEEEMAKLVSKLETQSSLTKHLHSLLVNR